jgi:hypothetical protein
LHCCCLWTFGWRRSPSGPSIRPRDKQPRDLRLAELPVHDGPEGRAGLIPAKRLARHQRPKQIAVFPLSRH